MNTVVAIVVVFPLWVNEISRDICIITPPLLYILTCSIVNTCILSILADKNTNLIGPYRSAMLSAISFNFSSGIPLFAMTL